MNRYQSVRAELDEACQQVGRAPQDVTLIAVSKKHPVSAIREASEAGARHFGESYVQEALPKIRNFGSGASWHFIGRLQRRKIRDIVQHFDMIHALDSVEHAAEIDKRANEFDKRMPTLVAVQFEEHSEKSGVRAAELPDFVSVCKQYEHIQIRGLMTLPPPVDNPEDNRAIFSQLRQLRDNLVESSLLPGDEFCELSMGMSDDFAVAVAEGATMVRIGTAIFGAREV